MNPDLPMTVVYQKIQILPGDGVLELQELGDVDEEGDQDDEAQVEDRLGFVLERMADGVKPLGADRHDHVNAAYMKLIRPLQNPK